MVSRVSVICSLLLSAFTLTLQAAPNPVPFIGSNLSPNRATPGSTARVLTIHGVGFVAASSVLWNGQALRTTFVNGQTLNAQIPASNLAAPATALITVLNPPPGGGLSNTAYFEVTWATPTAIVFETRANVSSPNTSLVSTDFDADGQLDLAAATGPSIAILLGNGVGTFRVSSIPTTAASVGTLVASDFNGDGKPDLAFPDPTTNLLHVFLGRGNGTFTELPTAALGTKPVWLCAGDFNADGKLDLAVVNQTDRTTWILLGNGDGTFIKKAVLKVGGRPNAVTLGDFNADGKLDLAVVNSGSKTVSILVGNGDGTFTLKSSPATGLSPFAIVAADFNGDGKLDLAVTNSCGTAATCRQSNFGSVSVLLGAGDGTFTGSSFELTDLHNPAGITAGDFNGDGKTDLAVVIQNESRTALVLGDGKGGFGAPIITDTGAAPLATIAGDFNNDGRLDYAVSNTIEIEGIIAVSVELQSPVAFYPDTLTFPPQKVGTTSPPKTMKFMNLGVSPITISNIGAGGHFSETNNCPANLAVGAGCTISITFSPAFVGYTGGGVGVTDDALGVQQGAFLQGTGK